LQTLGVVAGREQVIALLESDALACQLLCQPIVAIDPDADVERKVRADAHEHADTLRIIQVEVVEVDVTELHPKLVATGKVNGNPFRLAGLQNHGDSWPAAQVLKVRLNPVLAAYLLRLHDVDTLGRSVLAHPIVVVARQLGQGLAVHFLDLSVRV
jgi:hypothetical protein